MVSPADIPRADAPIAANGGFATRAWVDFFLKLASAESSENLAALYAALAARVDELEGDEALNFQILGQGSISVNGIPQPGGVVIITLQNDVAAPGNTSYYGTGPSGAKGWHPISGALTVTPGDLVKTVGSDGVTNFGLANVADSGTGTLLATTFDAKGRKTGSKAATITGTASQIVVANGDASAGLPTLSLAPAVLSSLGKADSAVQSVVAGSNITVNNADPQNPIVSAASGGGIVESVVAGLALTVDSTDPANPVVGVIPGTTGEFLRGDGSFESRLDGPLGIFQDSDIADGVVSICANSVSNPVPGIEVWADNGSTQANISSTTYGVNGGGIMHGRMARGTKASPSAVLKGDIYCGFGGRPYASGSGFVASSPVSLHWVASENQASAALGGYFRILTTPKGSNARIERLLINDVGSVWNHDTGTYDPTSEAQTKPFSTGWNGFICSATGQNSRNITLAYRNGVGGSAVFNIGAANGTPASPAFLSNNNEMGYNLFSCWNGSGWSGTASMLGYASENHSASALGSGLVFETTPNGSTSRSVRLRIDQNGPVTPGSDNSQTLGSASLRWSTVYAGNGTINTSDADLKTSPRDMTDCEVSAFLEIGKLPMIWQWLSKIESEGRAARVHAGPTVQAAISVMSKHGLKWQDYGAFCYDQWDEQSEIIGDDGTIVLPHRAKGRVYGFRKDELCWLVMRALISKLCP